jgi:hypothetical protein
MSTDKYDKFADLLRAKGLSEHKITAFIESQRAEDSALDSRVCPKCAAALTREIDTRQAGEGRIAGQVWVMYRCAACRFMMDRTETEAEA